MICPDKDSCNSSGCRHMKPHEEDDGCSKFHYGSLCPACVGEVSVVCPSMECDAAECVHIGKHQERTGCEKGGFCPGCVPTPESKPTPVIEAKSPEYIKVKAFEDSSVERLNDKLAVQNIIRVINTHVHYDPHKSYQCSYIVIAEVSE